MNYGDNDKYIWFVRHGESRQNLSPTMTHVPNEQIPLSDKGVEQAKHLAEISEVKADKIYISPYERAIHTATPYIHKLVEEGHFPMITVDKALKEFNYYNTNIRDALYVQTGGTDTFTKILDHYWEELDVNASHGYATESFQEFLARVVVFLSNLINVHNYGNLVVFSHYYVITCIRNIFIAGVGEDDTYFNLPAMLDALTKNPQLLKKLMQANQFDENTDITNCSAFYVHLTPYSPNSPRYNVVEMGFRNGVNKDAIVGEDIVVKQEH